MAVDVLDDRGQSSAVGWDFEESEAMVMGLEGRAKIAAGAAGEVAGGRGTPGRSVDSG